MAGLVRVIILDHSDWDIDFYEPLCTVDVQVCKFQTLKGG